MEGSPWEVAFAEASERLAARKRRIARRLEMSAKMSADLAREEQEEEDYNVMVTANKPATPATFSRTAAVAAFATAAAMGGAAIREATDPVDDGKHVENQVRESRRVLAESLDAGGELVSNVLLAAEQSGAQHRRNVDDRDTALKLLLLKEKEESAKELEAIASSWPSTNVRGYRVV